MVLACVPATALTATAEDTTPTIYVMEDVYGKPGETVAVQVGFKNTNGKNIQQFQANISAGEAAINQTTAISVTPMFELKIRELPPHGYHQVTWKYFQRKRAK